MIIEYEYTIRLAPIPKAQFDAQMFKYENHLEIVEWCCDRFGSSYIPGYNQDGVWASGIEYQNDHQDIAQVFSFKHEVDALLFALRWS